MESSYIVIVVPVVLLVVVLSVVGLSVVVLLDFVHNKVDIPPVVDTL
jgi:hypothetical protein